MLFIVHKSVYNFMLINREKKSEVCNIVRFNDFNDLTLKNKS